MNKKGGSYDKKSDSHRSYQHDFKENKESDRMYVLRVLILDRSILSYSMYLFFGGRDSYNPFTHFRNRRIYRNNWNIGL